MYLLLLFGAIGCVRLIPYLKNEVQFIHMNLKSRRKYHEQLREDWRELMTEKPKPTSPGQIRNEVPDFLKEETEELKKEILELSAIVGELKPIPHGKTN